jgi:UDP-N-acetylglucosamine:LPS N-acetylglucosamine transferase
VLVGANVTTYNHLPAEQLLKVMLESSFIISRCGYSTVMDIMALKKKSILIPTPGQTEQEYLAKHLMKKNFALTIVQNKFKLKAALNLAASYEYRFDMFSNQQHLTATIENFLFLVQSKRCRK